MLRGYLRKSKMYGADTDAKPAGGSAATPPATDADAGASGEPKDQAGATASKSFTQADVDRIVQERLDRASRKAEADAAKAKAEQEQAALQAQGEWKTLAEQREARIKELEPLATQLEEAKDDVKRYRSAITKYAEVQAATVPESVRSLLKKMDPVDQLDWLAENAATFTATADKPAAIGTPRNSAEKKPAVDTKVEIPRKIVKF